MNATLITNVAIFDGTGAAPFRGEVLIEGERIKAVARGAERLSATGIDVVDGQGGTLTPGLIEPHAHLTFTSSVDRIVPNFMPPLEEHAFITAHNAKTLLDYGFTSAVSGGATRPAIEIKLRDEIAAGFLPGPRLKAASFERSVQGNSGPNSRSSSAGVEEVDKFCREMIALGVDSFKFILSGASSIFPQHFDVLCHPPSEIEAASRIAKEHGIRLLGHCYSSESIALAVRNGFDAIYHCNFADEPTLDLMEEHKDKFVVVPAVGIIEASLTRMDLIPEGSFERNPEAQRGLRLIDEGQQNVLPKMRQRGIRVLPGGDYGFVQNPHGRNAWEFELFQRKFGFEPPEILRAATKEGAALMGMEHELGLIRPGFLADLLVVDGDALADLRLFQNRDALRVIMKAGKFHKRAHRDEARQRLSA